MKTDKPENSNYCATVVRIKNIVPLENCDNVVATSIFGFQAIVGKETEIGDIGIVFPTETQLSDEFCYHNNLFRHGDKNADQGKKGYIEDNRRIRAQKFRGHVSNALFMPLDSLSWTGIDPHKLNEGNEFDHLGGKEVCRKYVVPRKAGRAPQEQVKRESRVDAKHMPEHYDTANFWKYREEVDPETEVIVTQKLHGTSIRIANTIVKRKKSLIDRLAALLGAKIQETEHDYVFGSRKVVKDANNPLQNHYYDVDIWTREGKRLEGLLPENYIVYAEMVGWTEEGAAIQKNYTYCVPLGNAELYIYRIAIVSPSGHVTDLSWDQVKEFCRSSGLCAVPEVWRGKLKDFDVDQFMDKRYFDEGHVQCLGLGSNLDIVDEGVCIRADGIRPTIFKAKAPKFLEHETALLDTGEEDLESTQSATEI